MVTTKPVVLDKKQATMLLNNFLEKFQNWCNQHRPPSMPEMEQFLSRQCVNICNGKQIGKGFQDFAARVTELQHKHSHTQINPCRDCLIAGNNKAVVQFEVNLTERTGEKKSMYIMAIATIEDNLISRWEQVAHTKSSAER